MMDIIKSLTPLYKKLLNSIMLANKKIIKKSLLLTFIDIRRSNDRFTLLSESSIPKHQIDRKAFKYLLDYELIRESDDTLGYYVITAKGIWKYELEQEILNENILISFINNKFFTFEKKSLDDKEKMVILSMIAARIFSKDIPMDLSKDYVLDIWKDIFLESHDFLKSENLIPLNRDSLLSPEGKGNTHPVFYRMMRVNNLPKSTFKIFKFSNKNRQYYLDIDSESNISIDKLAHLLNLIVGQSPSFDLINSLSEFCKRIAYEYAINVVDKITYIKPKYDDLVEEALKTLISV